jgi:hypothetical protein
MAAVYMQVGGNGTGPEGCLRSLPATGLAAHRGTRSLFAGLKNGEAELAVLMSGAVAGRQIQESGAQKKRKRCFFAESMLRIHGTVRYFG